jgi:hypothetical protein
VARRGGEQSVALGTIGGRLGFAAARNSSRGELLGAGEVRASSSKFATLSGAVGASESS